MKYLSKFKYVIVIILGTLLIMTGEFSAGLLLAFQGLLSSFMGPVDSIIALGQQVQEMRSSMERVQDVLEYPADVSEGIGGPQGTASKLSGSVEIDHVSFGLDFKIFWVTIFKIFTNADNENKGETVKK